MPIWAVWVGITRSTITTAWMVSTISFGVSTEAGRGSTAVQPGRVGSLVQLSMGGSTAVQPGRAGLVVQSVSSGRTAVQPGAVGVVMQVARAGNTAVQPGAVGVVIQGCIRPGLGLLCRRQGLGAGAEAVLVRGRHIG